MKKTVINAFQKNRTSKRAFLVVLFLLFFIATNSIRAQGLSDYCWQNAFGSLASINSHDLATGEFSGTYGSTTGSSGSYTIIGKTPTNPDLDSSFPVTFTIGWATISAIPDDNSQYWTSTMSGYYNNDGKEKTLNLLNVISAPGPFEEVKILEPGNFPQTQSFTTIPKIECEGLSKVETPPEPDDLPTETDVQYGLHLFGDWTAVNGDSTGEITKITVKKLVPKGNNFENLRYYEVSGDFDLKGAADPVSFTGIAGPHIALKNAGFSGEIFFVESFIPSKDTDFKFAMSIVGSYQDSNISLSGFSNGDGFNNMVMFLTKSYKNAGSSIDANFISSGELFHKRKINQ